MYNLNVLTPFGCTQCVSGRVSMGLSEGPNISIYLDRVELNKGVHFSSDRTTMNEKPRNMDME